MTLYQISVNIILFFVKINQLVISIFEYFKYRRLFLTYFYYVINYNTHLIQKLHIKCKKKMYYTYVWYYVFNYCSTEYRSNFNFDWKKTSFRFMLISHSIIFNNRNTLKKLSCFKVYIITHRYIYIIHFYK